MAGDSPDLVAKAAAAEAQWGHPGDRWDDLMSRVQDHGVQQFADVQQDWLDLMWCLDRFRIAQAPPRDMGKLTLQPGKRLAGIYRSKGNWFATLLSLLLHNRTGQPIRSRGGIKGHSQPHQIDVAWPDREVAPITCAETKITGAPAFGDTPARGAMSDWSNRRKELKFAATDLKLARRDQSEKIGHWDVWRHDARPLTFMLWGARMTPKDSAQKMADETAAILHTYLDGAGVFAWRESAASDGYEPVAMPASPKVEDIDMALYRIASHIEQAVARGEHKDVPKTTDKVDQSKLAPDE